jgi:lipid-binding SYLF domain-containing protein
VELLVRCRNITLNNCCWLSKRKLTKPLQIRQAHGIAFVSVLKTGMSMLGGSNAGGCVIAKLPVNGTTGEPSSDEGTRWSSPSCISCSGLGGALLGGQRIDCMIILNTKSALRGFVEGKTVVLGEDMRCVRAWGESLDGVALEKPIVE